MRESIQTQVLVSVIVPTNRVSPELHQCLSSLTSQSADFDFEILVVLNGAASDLEIAVAGITVLREAKRGPAAARNAGVHASRGRYVAFVDSDCIAAPQWLNSAIARLQNESQEIIVAGRIDRSGADRNSISLFDSVSYLQQENYVKYSGACTTANLVMRRSTFYRVGAFDEQFWEAACEDWEWCLRAKSAHVPIKYEPLATVDHPCMYNLGSLRSKAKRLGRGEALMRKRQSHPEVKDYSMSQEIRLQLRRIKKVRNISRVQKVALYALSLLVAVWIWEAQRMTVGDDGGKSA